MRCVCSIDPKVSCIGIVNSYCSLSFFVALLASTRIHSLICIVILRVHDDLPPNEQWKHLHRRRQRHSLPPRLAFSMIIMRPTLTMSSSGSFSFSVSVWKACTVQRVTQQQHISTTLTQRDIHEPEKLQNTLNEKWIGENFVVPFSMAKFRDIVHCLASYTAHAVHAYVENNKIKAGCGY